jgi:predicted nucleic acid-binding protein
MKGLNSAEKVVSMTHDVLLAVSARRSGICVITENRRDFEKIHTIKPFRYQVWEPKNQALTLRR